MSFQWIKGSTTSPSITVYANNITLNNAAADYFKNVRYCLLGIDSEAKQIAIKPVPNNEIELNIYDKAQLNKVSMGKGYARISNKAFIEELDKLTSSTNINSKFDAVYNEKESLLVVDLTKGEN